MICTFLCCCSYIFHKRSKSEILKVQPWDVELCLCMQVCVLVKQRDQCCNQPELINPSTMQGKLK